MKNRTECTMRQVKAAEDVIDRKIRHFKERWHEENPGDWDAEKLWKKKHPSPRDRLLRKLDAEIEKLRKQGDSLLFGARMGSVSPTVLEKSVEGFAS